CMQALEFPPFAF
nr:immunoglobulin light chain junction region [Macaca mulatta]MOY04674.1 immunoglobulin light chain junction region [Macaca mulatta]